MFDIFTMVVGQGLDISRSLQHLHYGGGGSGSSGYSGVAGSWTSYQ
jgi:hypothetical protein